MHWKDHDITNEVLSYYGPCKFYIGRTGRRMFSIQHVVRLWVRFKLILEQRWWFCFTTRWRTVAPGIVPFWIACNLHRIMLNLREHQLLTDDSVYEWLPQMNKIHAVPRGIRFDRIRWWIWIINMIARITVSVRRRAIMCAWVCSSRVRLRPRAHVIPTEIHTGHCDNDWRVSNCTPVCKSPYPLAPPLAVALPVVLRHHGLSLVAGEQRTLWSRSLCYVASDICCASRIFGLSLARPSSYDVARALIFVRGLPWIVRAESLERLCVAMSDHNPIYPKVVIIRLLWWDVRCETLSSKSYRYKPC